MHDPVSFMNTIRMNRPNDQVAVVCRQKDVIDTLTAQLRSYPVTSHHQAAMFDGGRSTVRDGFRHIFVQDGVITASACGGPVFGIQKHFVGINMACYSRISTIVVTPQALCDFVQPFFAVSNHNSDFSNGAKGSR